MIPDYATKHGPDISQAEQVDSHDILRILESHGSERSALIAVLGEIQARYRHLPEDALRIVAERTGVSLVDVYAAATFYHAFSLTPKGRHIISCCLGTACHVRGGQGIADEFQRQLGIGPGETTSDMKFSLQTVNCLGACALGPVVVADGRYYSKVTGSRVRHILDETLRGPDKLDPTQDRRLFPIEVDCPHCGRSLMQKARLIDGRHAIQLSFALNGLCGTVWMSSLYGTHNVNVEPDIFPDTVPDISCPHCAERLDGSWQCSTCGACMMTLNVRGGAQLHVCSRRGCTNRLLDLGEPRPEPAEDGVR